MTGLLNYLIAFLILLYLGWCGYSAILYLQSNQEPLKANRKARYIYLHGKFTLYIFDAVFVAGIVFVFVSWLAHNLSGI